MDLSGLNNEILSIFYRIASIPHGSGNTAAMREYLVEFAKSCGYNVRLDDANNILASKVMKSAILDSKEIIESGSKYSNKLQNLDSKNAKNHKDSKIDSKNFKIIEYKTKDSNKLQNLDSKLTKITESIMPKICFQSHYDMVCVGAIASGASPKLIESTQIIEFTTLDSNNTKVTESAIKDSKKLQNLDSKNIKNSKTIESATLDSNNIKITESNNKKVTKKITQTWLKAQDSSLGADNGIGMAIMLYFMSKKINAEFLFTNDEEIGMIGAKNLSIPIESKLLINLDSERLGEITIGCAGGFDLTFSGTFHAQNLPHGYHYYTLNAKNFVGGHSGIDINNKSPNFQNAIIKSLTFLSKITESSNHNIKIIHIKGGEKRNSIPANCKIIFASENSLEGALKGVNSEFFEITRNESVSGRDIKPINETFMDKKPCGVAFETLFSFISSVRLGVLEEREGVVQSSLNLSLISFENGVLNLAFMGRANTQGLLNANLESLRDSLCNSTLMLNVKTQVGEYYAPWEKDADFSYEEFYKSVEMTESCGVDSKDSGVCKDSGVSNDFKDSKDSKNLKCADSKSAALKLLFENMRKYVRDVGISPKIVELHAGLECGILLSRFKQMGCNNITALSLGPSIHSPHSTKERVWIESCGIITRILLDFLSEY